MSKQKKILEIISSGNLVMDVDKRSTNENYLEDSLGVRVLGDSYIISKDWGTRQTFGTSPIRPNAHIVVTGATNASPIVISTANTDGLQAGDLVYVDEILGNTAANGTWVVGTVVANTSFGLVGSTGNGAYTSGGIWCSPDTDTVRNPITIHKSFMFFDKNAPTTEYYLVFGIDSSSNSRVYVYDPNSTEASKWIELSRYFDALINEGAGIGASDTNFDFDTLTENGVTYTGAADFVNNWIVVNTQSGQNNEAVFITDSTASNLTVDTVVGSNGLGWANNDTLRIYRFPCFKFNWTASNGTTPHVDFIAIEDQRKVNIFYTDSSTPQVARQAIQVMKRDERSYLPSAGTSAVAQIIVGTPVSGDEITVVSGYGAVRYNCDSQTADQIATSITNGNLDVTAVNAAGTITVTANAGGTTGNSFYMVTDTAQLQVSNVSQGATSSGTRYFEGGAVGGSYLRALPAGWYCESDYGILNPFFLARGTTTSPYTANTNGTIYDQLGTTSNRPWMITNSKRTTDVAIDSNSYTLQRVYLAGEYGLSGYQRSDPFMQLFIESNNTTTGSSVSSHYLGINFALMNKELYDLTFYACQHNSNTWIDSSSEYFLCYTVNIQSTNTNCGFANVTTAGVSQIYTLVISGTTNYLTITPTTISEAENSGANNLQSALNHEVDKNRSYTTPRFARIATQGDGSVVVTDDGDNAFRIANHNGSGALEDDNFPDVTTDVSGNRLKVKTSGVGVMLGIEILDGIIHIIRGNSVELYDLQGVFQREYKIDCVAKSSIHVTPYGIAFAGKASIFLIPIGGGEIIAINPLWEDYYNGSLYVTGTTTQYVTDTYRNAIIAGYDEVYKESWFNIQVNTASSSEIRNFRYNYASGKWTVRKINTTSTVKNFLNSRVSKAFRVVTGTSVLEYPVITGSQRFEDDVRINGAGSYFSQSLSVPLDATINIAQFDDEVQGKTLTGWKLNFEGSSTDTYGMITVDFLANNETTAFDTQYVRMDELMLWRGVTPRGSLERLRIRFYSSDDVNLGLFDVKKILLKFID